MLANPPVRCRVEGPEEGRRARSTRTWASPAASAPGCRAINDGSLLFLQHMISKMHPYAEGDDDAGLQDRHRLQRLAAVLRRCRLAARRNIRRWIIENDWLDAIVALPDQLFYNTGIYTYVWLVTNRKPPERRGKVQLIDGTRFFQKMKKSLNNKRNEITEDQIADLTRIYGNYQDGETAEVADRRRDGDPRRLAHLRQPRVRLPQGHGRAPAAA